MGDPRTQIVVDGYDAIGETFAEWRKLIVGDPGPTTFQWMLARR